MPGRNGSSLPYGSVTNTNFRSVDGWINSGDENYDYGAIIIPTQLGNTVGWFGFGVYSDAVWSPGTSSVSRRQAGTQWYDARKIASVNSRKVYYDIDTVRARAAARSTDH
jgi:V8-like Glu-specific endopeptidase